MTSTKEQNINTSQLFDNLSFKLKDQFFLDKIMLKKTSYASFNTNKSLPVSTRGFLSECNKESLMDSEISSI